MENQQVSRSNEERVIAMKSTLDLLHEEQIKLLRRKKIIGGIGAIFGGLTIFLSLEPLFIDLVMRKIPTLKISVFTHILQGMGLLIHLMGVYITFIYR